MEQTRLLLIAARVNQNYTDALDVMCLVQRHLLPTTIEDTMYGYMVAKDWCLWIKTPGEPSENPLLYGLDDDLRCMFESYAEKFEYELFKVRAAIEEYIALLNPNLIELYRGRNLVLKEDTRLLYRALRHAAQMFEEKSGDNFLNELLDRKRVPPMSELSKSWIFGHVSE